jgi:hypothetical protein
VVIVGVRLATLIMDVSTGNRLIWAFLSVLQQMAMADCRGFCYLIRE